MEALYQEVTAKRELERSFEDMVKEIQHLIEQMDDDERRLSGREPVPEHRQVRERQARSVHEEIVEEIAVSLNYLSTRFQCSWPWDILVMLCDGRLCAAARTPTPRACSAMRARPALPTSGPARPSPRCGRI